MPIMLIKNVNGSRAKAVTGGLGRLILRIGLCAPLHSFPGPPIVPGVPEETLLRYNTGGSALMTGRSLVPAYDVTARRVASPVHSMVRESSVTLVSGASRIPFERSSRFRRFPLVLPSTNQPGAGHAHAHTGRR